MESDSRILTDLSPRELKTLMGYATRYSFNNFG